MAAELHARDNALLSASLDRSLALNTSTSAPTDPKRNSIKSTTDASTKGAATAATTTTAKDDDDDADEEDDDRRNEDVLYRLDNLGFRVGQGLVERFSANAPRPTTPLDMIKFVCKDLWQLVFRKQIDNLKTNHRGTFVLTDARFLPLARMSVDTRRGPKGVDEALRAAQPVSFFSFLFSSSILS